MTIETGILIVVTLANAAIAVDTWIHRRERRETELAQIAEGRPSLKTRIDDLIARLDAHQSSLVRTFDTMERLRLERAAILANELAAVHRQIDDLHQKASDFGSQQQHRIGAIDIRLVRIETRVRDLDRRQADWNDHDE